MITTRTSLVPPFVDIEQMSTPDDGNDSSSPKDCSNLSIRNKFLKYNITNFKLAQE